MFKMHQNTFGGRSPSGPAARGSLCAPPVLLLQWEPISKEIEGRAGEGLLLRGTERREVRREETERDGKRIPSPKSR